MEELAKKGIMDIFPVIAIVFGVAITTILAVVIITNVNEEFTDFVDDYPTPNSTWNVALEMRDDFDGIVLAALIVLIIIALILAAVIPANPVFIPVYIMVAIFGVIITVPLSNGFEEFINDSSISGAAAYFPMATFIFANLPVIIVALIVMMMIVTYAKGGMSNER